jgi:hypothetical protein
MPDCKMDLKLVDLYKRLDEILLEKENAIDAATGGAWDNLVGDLEDFNGDVVGDTLNIAAAGILNGLQEDLMNGSAFGGISSYGTMIALLLSAGQTSYLGLAAMLLYLLQLELERRIKLSQFLMFDLKAINQLLLLIINSPALKGRTNSLDNIRASRNHVLNAETTLGEAYSQLQNLNYFSPTKLDSSDSELEKAKNVLSTPIADAISKIITDSHLLRGPYRAPEDRKSHTWEDVYNYIQDPESLVEDAKFLTENVIPGGDPVKNQNAIDANVNRYIKEVVDPNYPQAATKEEKLDTMIAGISEYVGIDLDGESLTSIQAVITQFATHFAKYIPYNPLAFASTMASVTGAIGDGDYSDAIDEIGGAMAQRTLFSLNNTIKQKVEWLSQYPKLWDDMSTLTSVMLPMLFHALDITTSVRIDMDKLIVDTPNTQTMLSAKMFIWKKKIDNIQTYIRSLESGGDQLASLGSAQESLDRVIAQLNEKKVQYEDDNDGTPESELAYELLSDILGNIWDVVTSQSKLADLQSSVAESILSVQNSIDDDEALMGTILSFCGNVLAIPGVEDSMKICENTLDSEKFEGTPIQRLIEEVRNGNLGLLINASMSSVSDITSTIEGVVSGENNPILEIAHDSIGSLFSTINNCADKFKDDKLMAKEFAEKDKAAKEKAAMNASSERQAITEAKKRKEEVDKNLTMILSTTLASSPYTPKIVVEDDIQVVGLEVITSYETLKAKTSDDLMTDYETAGDA